MRSISEGTLREFRLSGAGSAVRIAARTSDGVPPVNGATPVTISYRTTPRLKMSLRPSTGRPRACSGDMYLAVPTMIPGCVSLDESRRPVTAASSVKRAIPKSTTFTTPSGRIMMFSGLISR